MSTLQIIGCVIIIMLLAFCIINLIAPTATKEVTTAEEEEAATTEVEEIYLSKDEAELEWLVKAEKCFKHFSIEERYKLSFKEFVAKIQNGVWEVMVSNGPLDETNETRKSNICTAYNDSWRKVPKQL